MLLKVVGEDCEIPPDQVSAAAVTMSTMQSKRRPEEGAEASEPQAPPEAVVDRLAGLLPEEALEDAVEGLEPEEITGPGGLLSQLAGRVIETALGAELTEHLGHPPGGVPQGANVRNGSTPKTVQTDLGPVRIRTPARSRRDRLSRKLVAKRQTRLAGLDDKILGLYAGGMTVRDISAHLAELYGIEIGRDTISRVTDAVLEDVEAWRTRPLERGLPDRLLRRAAGQGPRGPLGAQPRLLPRARASPATATARCWGSGGRRPRARSSGWPSSTTCAAAASRTS